jgi:UDP-N-acetylglucosamine pyrophosphorylase
MSGSDIKVYKSEYFIFDALPRATAVEVVAADRRECFAPLKNKNGADSPLTVSRAILERDRRRLATITGTLSPDGTVFELAPDFYYPTPALLSKWKNILPVEDYIES